MARIDKTYFTLKEIQERWALTRCDLAYLAENGMLRLSVRVFGTSVEYGEIEALPEGRWFNIPHERTCHSGLLDLHDRDACSLFRNGQTSVDSFHADEGMYVCLIEPTGTLDVRMEDVVVRREERDRVEARERLLAPADGASGATIFSDDFRDVRLGTQRFQLGPIQAEVIRRLHMAQSAGEPWCHGKALLTGAGSRSLRMADVFKSQPDWRRLIRSDGRGRYRLVDR